MTTPRALSVALEPSVSALATHDESSPAPSANHASVPTSQSATSLTYDVTDPSVHTLKPVVQSWPPTYDLVGTIPLTLDILVVLVEHSEFLLLAAFRRTCSALYCAVGVRLRLRYENCLKPFVDDVPLLDQLLIRHGAIISGSVALHFFLPRSLWQPNDLDIYVPETEFESFIEAATRRSGLDFTIFPHRRPWETIESRDTTPSLSQSSDVVGHGASLPHADTDDSSEGVDDWHVPSVLDGIREVRVFYTPSYRRVDVISVPSNNPVHALKQFWASLVMNFLRPDLSVCGFPATTLEGVALLKAHMTTRDCKASAKYADRGFELSAETHSQLTGVDFWETPFFGARRALVMPFRLALKEPRPESPLVRTDRGWVLSSSWPRPPPTPSSKSRRGIKDHSA